MWLKAAILAIAFNAINYTPQHIIYLSEPTINPNYRSFTDGYAFQRKQFHKDKVKIKLITYDSVEEFRKAVTSKKEFEGRNIAAYSVVYKKRNYCEIHIVSPDVRYEPHYAGHELYHCFYGHWHD
jgi:hypothetical protein